MTRLSAFLLAATLWASPALADDAPAKAEAATTQATDARLLGKWKIQLNAQQQSELGVFKLALREPPPTQAEIDALPAEMQAIVEMLAMIKKTDPTSAQLVEIRTMIESLEHALLTIDATTMGLSFGTTTVSGPYTVSAGEGDAITLAHRPEGAPAQTMSVTFPSKDLIEVTNDKGQATQFARQP